jgi:hypothetical protein
VSGGAGDGVDHRWHGRVGCMKRPSGAHRQGRRP